MARMTRPSLLIAFAVLAALSAGSWASRGPASAAAAPLDTSFSAPTAVTITGYDGDAMEPFVSRDGTWLLFNTRNLPGDATDLQLARRIDADHFQWLGPLEGANSKMLDGAASLDRSGNLYFVSNRNYDHSGNTLWRGRMIGTRVVDVREIEADFTKKRLLRLNIDLEISADGQSLYFAENRWDLFRARPATSDLAIAQLRGTRFVRDPQSAAQFAAVNSPALEYAPDISLDQLTLYFTRLDLKRLAKQPEQAFSLMVSNRPTRTASWGQPRTIAAAQGVVEGPALSPDGCALYFHKLVNNRFGLWLMRQPGCAPRSLPRTAQ